MRRLLTSLLFIISFSAQAKPHTGQNNNWYHFKPSRHDKIIAKNLDDLYHNRFKRKSRKSRTRHLLRLVKKNSLFNSFYPLLRGEEKLLNAKTKKSIARICFNRNYEIANSIIHARYLKKFMVKCSTKYLSLIKHNSLPSPKILLRIFSKHLTRKNNRLFLNKLKLLEKNAFLFSKLSTGISDYYISSNKKPSLDVISRIDITDDLSFHLQEKYLLDLSTSKFFNKELLSMFSNTSSSIRNNEIARAKKTLAHIISFSSENKKFLKQTTTWKRLISIGMNFLRKGHNQEALQVFKHAQNFASKRQLQDTYFYRLWVSLYQEDYKGAIAEAELINMFNSFENISPKNQFWISYSLGKINEITLAKHFLKRTILLSPMSFYGVAAFKELNLIDRKYTQTFYNISNAKPLRAPAANNLPHDEKMQQVAKRLVTWISIGASRMRDFEISDLRSLSLSREIGKNNIFSDIEIIKYLNSKSQFLASFKIFYSTNDSSLNKQMLSFLFPFNYINKIAKFAKGIDPILILSLIRQESAFNPSARSHAGAKGLMQLMPATARELSKRIKTSKLNSPKINIYLGVKYLRKLLKQNKGNLVFALAAYNAGPGNLRRWKKNIFNTTNPLLLLESIPFSETRNYVKLIYRNQFFYNLLKNNHDFINAPLEQNFKTNYKVTKR